MAIARNPKSTGLAHSDPKAEHFIAGAGKHVTEEDQVRKPIQLRLRSDLLERIDRAAERRGITRTAFIVSTVTEKLEAME
jgi:Protein of unknown function (DUF1778)